MAAAASAQAEVQTLLRFLTKDAKLPLSDALPKVKVLIKQGLNNVTDLAKTQQEVLKPIFGNEKIAKQVINAAKRATTSKKRGAADLSAATTISKRVKTDGARTQDISEDHLTLPISPLSADAIFHVIIETNRAPLVLAFAVIALQYTMPEQPLSSRLSLAQALVSANSQSKAKSIGIVDRTADDDGWAEGQPKVKVLGRDIAVLRRHNPSQVAGTTGEEQELPVQPTSYDTFWGMDLEAMRKSTGPFVPGRISSSTGPPIHTPQAARAYLMKSMTVVEKASEQKLGASKKKLKPAQVAEMKENALSMMLRAIDLLCQSWATKLTQTDLDSRAWSWYIRVRPDVAQGQAGWGQKGRVNLGDILKLRREPSVTKAE